MPESVFGHFKPAVFKHERGPLTTWCKMQTDSLNKEAAKSAKIICMALIRLNPKSEPCYHTGRVILEYFHRVAFKSSHPALFDAIRGRAESQTIGFQKFSLAKNKKNISPSPCTRVIVDFVLHVSYVAW
eukprot:2679773-Amphidinium_carterae.9